MLNIVMENDHSIDGIPAQLQQILKTRFLENRQYWLGFTDKMKSHREEALVLLDNIPAGSNIIGQTNFHEEDQLEKFIHVMTRFMQQGKSMNFYTVLEEQVFGTMEQAFGKYIAMNEAFQTPTGYNKRDYKELLNHMLMSVMEYHNMYRMVSDDPEDDRRLTYENCVLAIPAGMVAPATSA